MLNFRNSCYFCNSTIHHFIISYYLCSPIIWGGLRIPAHEGVNSNVFGRALWLVNRSCTLIIKLKTFLK